MNPLFLCCDTHTINSVPSRILGLLRNDKLSQNPFRAIDKVVEYQRPERQFAQLKTARWTDYLQLDIDQHNDALAVFGFHFDGESTWYQLWHTERASLSWIAQTENLQYEPFAILAMDELVSLWPTWKGLIFPQPTLSADGHSRLADQNVKQIEAKKVDSVVISDAVTDSTGELWFLVTVNCLVGNKRDTTETSTNTRVESRTNQPSRSDALISQSGWITRTPAQHRGTVR